MVIDLTRIFEQVGERESFSSLLDLSDFRQFGQQPLKAPVAVSGVAENAAGVVQVSYTARYRLDVSCDRCLKPLAVEDRLLVERIAVRALSGVDNDEYLVLPDGKLDLQEMVYSDLVLSLPSKYLCDEDCKGLCPVCGNDRNTNICACQTEEGDSRLRILKGLLH